MILNVPSAAGSGRNRGGLWLLALCLAATLGFLFFYSFEPGQALFSNDGPLGVQKAQSNAVPAAFSGIWGDLYWLGGYYGSFFPNITGLLMLVLGPLGYNNFLAPIALLILGMSAGFFFRQLGFKPFVCVLGGLATALNMNFFSNACWGLSSRALALAMTFLALAAIVTQPSQRIWLKAALAGCCIGIGVTEGFDNGAIFSVYIAGFAFYQVLTQGGKVWGKIFKGAGLVAVMAFFAAFLSWQALETLVTTALRGAAASERNVQSSEHQWDWATQWSTPKAEALRVIIPGLFGYRMQAADGSVYWGTVGRQPGWDEHHQGFARHSGSGEYAGVLVVLIALWGLAQSLRENKGPFSPAEKKVVWFWGVIGLLSLLFAFGRHAPFYRLLYELPYFSTIRNPMKFMHLFHLALLILFGYGLQGISRLYLEKPLARADSLTAQLKNWWAVVAGFEKKWTIGMILSIAASLLGWLLYASAKKGVIQYLQRNGFSDESFAAGIARFSFNEVGLFIVFLFFSALLVVCLMAGVFAGARARWAGIFLGVLLVADLSRANAHWIVYYTYSEKYATNPVIDILRDKPYEHRVGLLPGQVPGQIGQQFQVFQQVYQIEWMQHHFPYYNVQALDTTQMPRMPEYYAEFMSTLGNVPLRLWQYTNTRYLFAPADAVDVLNGQLDPEKKRFRRHTAFTLTQDKKGLISAAINDSGPFALIDFTGALPRAKLYANWEISTNDQAALKRMVDPAFDPLQAVVLAQTSSVPASASAPNANPGTVAFTSYSPKRILFKASAATPAVLLLNDKYDPNWKVRVDGRPETLLRCNYLMRGVFLQPGEHTVEFRFAPPTNGLYVSLAAIGVGLVLLGFAAFSRAPANGSGPARC